MINLIFVPIVIAIIAAILTLILGGFRSFTNLAFLVPVVITGLITFAYGHPYNYFADKAEFDYDRIGLGIICAISGMVIGCLLRRGFDLSRQDEPVVLNRPGHMPGCKVNRLV
jgi:hypothetical protein